MTGTAITPIMGQHAHLYDGVEVRQLDGPPEHDSVTSRYVDVRVWCYCPACGCRVSEIWHYLRESPGPGPDPGVVIPSVAWTVGFRLRPCGHYVTSICWHMNPDGQTPDAAHPVPPLPPAPTPFASEL